MWRPLEIYLYEWWPIRRMALVFDKLSDIDVELRVQSELTAPNAAMSKLVGAHHHR